MPPIGTNANRSFYVDFIISRPALQTVSPHHYLQMTGSWRNTPRPTGVGLQKAINLRQGFSRPIIFPTWSATLPFLYG